MQIVSTREFRANQTRFLDKVMNGESVILKYRGGSVKLSPVTDSDNLTDRICRGLDQVKLIRDGKLPRRTINDMLDEM